MKHPGTLLFLFICFSPMYGYAQSDTPELTWPREVITAHYTTTLYQPQLESFRNNVLTGRMAVSVQEAGTEDLVFGALWFTARMATDLDERLVVLQSIDIGQTRFPDVEEDKIEAFARSLEAEIEGMDIVMSLDRLLAALEVAEDQQALAADFINTPPNIYYRENSAALIYIDGEPILKNTEDENIEYVVNTPYFIVRDNKQNMYYLKGGSFWYASGEIISGWSEIGRAPKNIEKMAEKVVEDDGQPADSLIVDMDTAPEIIVVTKPAELIITDGTPDYAPIDGTSLLYVKNTESDIILNIQNQTHYVLLAGRWYTSKNLKDGSWTFIEPKTLPEDFQRIPAEGEMASVRPSVPGTEEAQAAVLEQTIPQTATVDRKTATTEVSYDGNPKFERIDKTEVARAVNADKTVLLIKDIYYVVDNAVWFESKNPTGPWAVCVDRPDEVDDIPPESEVYNVKYVYIYDATPEVVYVGYTPGYTWSYVYGGVVVYGTGWYYRPWYGSVYYPRPVTWGFHVHYNPWTGWGFSFGVSYGWFSMGWHSPYYGWWGPAGYRHGYRHGYYRGYQHGYWQGTRAGYVAGYRAAQTRPETRNVYKNRANGVASTGIASTARPSTRPATRPNEGRPSTANRPSKDSNRPGTSTSPSTGASRDRVTTQPSTTDRMARPSTRPNDVYTDPNGNVYRRDNSGSYQQRDRGTWQGASNNRSNNNSQLNRSYDSRQRGNTNYNNFNRSRSSSSTPARSSGGGSRTGGRRR